jgi:signal transduction histidine kinase
MLPSITTVDCLLVDDREANLVALEALLRADGIRLHKAHSGTEALELLLQHDIALALLDVQMPDMDGFELAELMRGAERTRHVPIIFLTAGGPDDQRIFRGYEAGAVDFIQKPIEPAVLRSKAAVFFDLYRQRSELARQRDELAAVIEHNQRLLEESHRYADALEEADRRKDEFLATLAHELRNPLAPIRTGLELMKFAMDDPPLLEETRATMERQTVQLIRLVDDLLDVSRITRGKLQLRKATIDLAEVVRDALATSKPHLEEGKHKVVASLSEDSIRVRGDANRLAQVISNLLNNAAKFTPPGGEVEIALRREGGEAIISVKDNGVGIPVEKQEQVFEMFSQVNDPLNRGNTGLGIGLTLVKSIVNLHGGSVEVQSEGAGHGSEFAVRLPIVGASEEAHTTTTTAIPLPTTKPTGSTLRVLVVDDNAAAAYMLSRIVEALGNETKIAADGEQAIASAEAFQPQVIFMDIGMPRMNGYEAAERIRQTSWGKDLVLVALTGWGQEEDRRRTQAAGFNHHLVKPADLDQVQQLLSAVASQARKGL